MNPENEEQKAVPQTLCGALQKEANCKCLVLSVLIYGCLAAVTWCRCANVPKIIINFSTFPIKSTKYVSPCDDGYIYIPVAFMGMLYLVYLVECYHSPIRIDLLHAEGQSSALAKLTQLKLAQPTIWWKAISYHYVRRKRQVMRYRNGDNFTTTQVYYERVNSHAATSFYFYDYCGSKDISKELALDPKIPITKITLSKGFAFSNVRSATEFEEARSRFFAEQEFRDDYMEMREGLDLGCNFSPMTLVAVFGNPWFTRSYVYWCLSALLLSWPLRIIIECKTQYVDYQITKLFGVNYDTPTNIQIHTSASQLSAPGSYMLAPSYSEALLMEPAGPSSADQQQQTSAQQEPGVSDMVPSYSEALLYERASAEHQPCDATSTATAAAHLYDARYRHGPIGLGLVCECPCHGLVEHGSRPDMFASRESLQVEAGNSTAGEVDASAAEQQPKPKRLQQQQQQSSGSQEQEARNSAAAADSRICENCLSTDAATERRIASSSSLTARTTASTPSNEASAEPRHQPRAPILERRRCIARDYSEPDLRRSAEMPNNENALAVLRANGRSLENIMENEEAASERAAEALVLERQQQPSRSTGAIPKRTTDPAISSSSSSSSASSSRVTVNPIAEAVKRLPNSRSTTYFCLKSILKQNRRRFTLVTPEELQSLTRGDLAIGANGEDAEDCDCDGCRAEVARPTSLRIDKQHRQLSCQSLNYRRENSRTLIFASPIQEICPLDPFGGRNRVPSENPPRYEEAVTLPVLSRIRRSFADRSDASTTLLSSTTTTTTTTTTTATTTTTTTTTTTATNVGASTSSGSTAAKVSRAWKHRRSSSNDPQLSYASGSGNTRTGLISSTETGRNSETAISIPSYDGITMPPDSRRSQSSADERSPFLGHDELAGSTTGSDDPAAAGFSGELGERTRSRLTRSLTERRSAPDAEQQQQQQQRRRDRNLRKSFAGVKRTNINIETSL